jgi:hypothetical protein
MIWGLDFLGLAKYGNLALAEFPDGWALGAFSRTFGDAIPAVSRILDTGRCPRVRLHLLWKDDHKFGAKEFEEIRREARRIVPFVRKYRGKIDIRISGACEHTLKRADGEKLKALVLKELPGVTYVNTPWIKGGGETISGVNEVHGNDAKAPRGQHDFSFDGHNAVDSDFDAVRKRFSDCDTFYIWNSQCNGRKTTGDKTPRPERKAWPTSRYIDSWIALSRERGAVSLPAKWIFKSHADQHDVPPEPRAGKPVWICPTKAAEIILRCRNGQIVDRARYFGPFTGGGFRYYSSDVGYLIAEKAIRIQGDGLCEVVINGKVVGVVHPAFRAGSFR